MGEELRSILIGTAGLSTAGLAAVLVTVLRSRPSEGVALVSVVRLGYFAVLVQSAHFVEEFATGFHVRFPELLSLEPWSPAFFALFNLGWLAIWLASCWGLPAQHPLAVAALWFLAIAGTVNGIAHPLLSVVSGGYFPGLVTSPFIGVVGALLARRLAKATQRAESVVGTL